MRLSRAQTMKMLLAPSSAMGGLKVGDWAGCLPVTFSPVSNHHSIIENPVRVKCHSAQTMMGVVPQALVLVSVSEEMVN